MNVEILLNIVAAVAIVDGLAAYKKDKGPDGPADFSDGWGKSGMTKYSSDFEGGDGLKILQPGDDAATANWGTEWRIPTIDEFRELIDNEKCKWTWDAENEGYTVRSLKTENQFPARCRASEREARFLQT